MKECPFPVLYQDDRLLVIAKPAGVLTVPPSGPSRKDAPSVQDRLRRWAREAGGEAFPVHRLDRDTSGVLVLARTREAKADLERAFRERTVEKRYLALVHGRLRPRSGTIRSFIEDRGKTARSHPRPARGAKAAVTRYRVLETFPQATLVEARPETGRFNQLRLHFADRGAPIVGERKYAVASRYPLRAKRVLLHAAGLRLPGRDEFECPLPDDFTGTLDHLRHETR